LSEFHYPIFLVAHTIEQVQNYITNIDIKTPTTFLTDDYEIIKDRIIRSPLIGLYTAFKELHKLNYQYSFILSCDNPFINIDVIKFMIKDFIVHDACIPIWNNNYIEPLFAIYKITPFLKKAEENLSKKSFKLSKLLDLDNLRINYVSIENEIKLLDVKLESFINLNELNDFSDIVIKSIKK